MPELGTEQRPLRVAIVGSGPSGFYAAEALFKAKELRVEVDMFDRLPTPYGLVRLGVAPDHQKIKSATKVYEKIATNNPFRFIGNVKIGEDLSVDELRRYYDAIIFATGAETDRRLNIPGEDLPGSHTATEFVAWYNGHPDYQDRDFDLTNETAVVIGQGNVAVDVCRILAKTVDELKNTDIAQYALDALAESKVRNIHMIGRRGPVQAKFTQQEIKEMGRLEDCDPIVDPKDLDLDPLSRAEYEHPENTAAPKIVPILEEFAARGDGNKRRKLYIDFLKSPVAIEGEHRVEKIVLRKNELSGEPFHTKANGTDETEELPCGLVFRSVGYRGVSIPGVPFDEDRAVIRNNEGRVLDKNQPIPGLYAAGWIKRGPTGVIGTNKPDSASTVAAICEDLDSLAPCENPNTADLLEVLEQRHCRTVSFEDWKRLDTEEVRRGSEVGKPREKFTQIAEILDFID